jgi:predicted nucleic acid-binding Zn ribbon protein
VSTRRGPRRAGAALRSALQRSAPRTLLSEVQIAWPEACGRSVSAEAVPVAERDGVVTVACRSATWAAELDMLQGTLLERLNGLLGEERVKGLRFTADGPRHGVGGDSGGGSGKSLLFP